MPSTELDLLFRRFQRTGDPRAIAAFYDRVAPELLLLAAHLGRREGDAEDLVQATFLAAIEAADSWDSTRRVMPWFVGILVNQARRDRRRAARRPDPDRLPNEPVEDPRALAEERELALLVAERLHALPEPYRQTLTLRWVHGLTPLEIAHALGLPPETVKTRLKRGRRALRRTLPAGVGAAGVLLLPRAGAASVRETVLAAAARRAPAASPGEGAGGLLGAAGPLGASVVVLLVSTIVLLARTPGPEAPPDAPPKVAAIAHDHEDLPSASIDAERAEAESASATGDVPSTAARVRVDVRFADGTPAARAVVRAARLGVADPLLREASLTADAEGGIDLEGLDPGEWRLVPLRGGAAVRVTSPPGGTERVTLTVPEGVDVSGRVLDPRGLPAAGVRVTLSRSEAPDEMIVATRTDGDGLYRLRDVEPGRSIGFLADGAIPVPLRRIEGPPGDRRSFDVDLADAESTHLVRGLVLDAAGAPVAGARVQIGSRLAWLDFDAPVTSLAQRSPPIELVTGPDGRFERRGFVAYPEGVPVWARAPGRPLATGTIRLDRDACDVVLVEPEATAIRGRVVEEDGAPIALARVVLRDPRVDDAGLAPRWVESVAWSDGEGRFVLPGSPRGTVHLTAQAPDGREATATLDAETGSSWTAVVREPRALRGRVVREDGRPIADLSVRALVPNGRIEPPSSTTDAWGRFDLGPLEPTTYDLWITDPASAWSGPVAAVPGVVPGAPSRLEVEPRRIPDASIAGRLVDEHGAPLAGRMFLRHVGVGLATALADPATGRFRFGPIPALDGGYLLHAESDDRFVRVAGIEPEPGGALDLGDLPLLPPGAVRFRLESTAAPALGAAAVTSAEGAWLEPIRIEAGESRPSALPPGRYLARLLDPSLAQSPTPFVVRSGEETVVTLRPAPAASRTFEVRVAPFVHSLGVELRWWDEDGTSRGHDRLSGRVAPFRFRQGFAPGRYRLEVVTGRGRTATATFDVAAPGDDAPPVIVDLR